MSESVCVCMYVYKMVQPRDRHSMIRFAEMYFKKSFKISKLSIL